MRPAFRRLCAAVVFSAAAFVLAVRLPNGAETGVHALVGSEAGALSGIASASAHRANVLFEGTDAELLSRCADSVASEFGEPTNSISETIAFLAAHRRGLLSPETRSSLLARRTDEVAAASLARLFGPMPPAVSPKLDPFQLVGDFALSLQSSLAPGWSMHNGHPIRIVGERHQLLLSLDLSRVDPERILAFLSRAESSPPSDVEIWCAGAPFHSAQAAEKSLREINLLSAVSLALVAFFGWLLLRSFRFVPLLAATLLFAFAVASAMLYLVWPRPHVFTFVFGTSLIGLAVDYVYHTLAAGARAVRRPLTLALATSAASFAPLLLAPVDALRQMALFTIVGLAAAWWFVRGSRFLASGLTQPHTANHGSWTTILALSILAVASLGTFRLHLSSDPATFYSPSSYLAAGERKLLEANPSGSANRFVFVRGETLQQALENEEAACLRGLSSVVPSFKRQRENAALVERLHAAEATGYAAKTGLKIAAPAGEFLDAEHVADPRLAKIVAAARVPGGIVAPCPDDFVPTPDAIVVEPRRELAELFSRFTTTTLKLLAISSLTLVVLLAVLFRLRFFRIACPVVAAIVATAGSLGWLGVPVTFFTLLCFFALVGLGLDYSIFRNHESRASRTVFFSFLTSLAGLGMLAFTDFAVTRQMGMTFALGLAYSWFFAATFSRREPRTSSREPKAAWHEQREQSSGPLRIRALWLTYRLLGKNVAKLVCVPVVACAFPFAGAARRSYSKFCAIAGNTCSPWRNYLHLLSFAWGLIDKTDACSLKKNLPKMSVVDDDGWRAFSRLLSAGKGAFVVTTHLGTAEVLPALPLALRLSPVPFVNAFQQMSHSSDFMREFMRHFDHSRLRLHAVEKVGVETAVAMQEAITRGELVMMAGDRTSAGSTAVMHNEFFGHDCAWPKGTFVFAKLLGAPVFFVSCVRTSWNRYTVRFSEFTGNQDKPAAILSAYAAFLEMETRAHPKEWFHFHDFFA